MYLRNVLVICGLFSMLSLSSGLLLACTYRHKIHDDLGLSLYTCEARVVPIGDERYVLEISSTSVHLDGYDNDDVEALEYMQPIGFTPRNVHSFFPNLQLIRADRIQSDSLTREDLTGFAKLRSLRFNYNDLREIGNDLFVENPLMEIVDFNYNRIQHVAHNVFDHLTELRSLYMLENACKSHYLSNRPDEIPEFLFEILRDCPPTFDMIEERIVNSNKLAVSVQSQIDSSTAIAILHAKLEAVVEQLRSLEERVEFLETSSISDGFNN